MMNFWTPTWFPWNKDFKEENLPWEAKYDFVETYTYDHETNGFVFHWRDDFDSFDQSKWYKSDNWGFEGNSSLFVAGQVEAKDGNLVLKLDKAPSKTGDEGHYFLHDAHYRTTHDKYAPYAPVAHHGDSHEPMSHYAHHDILTKQTRHDDDDFYDHHAFEPLTRHTHQPYDKEEKDHKYTEGEHMTYHGYPHDQDYQTPEQYWEGAGESATYPEEMPVEWGNEHYLYIDPIRGAKGDYYAHTHKDFKHPVEYFPTHH